MRRKLLYIMFIFSIILFGCTSHITEITAPPDNMSLDEVTKINLKTLDLNKLSKNDIYEIDGIQLKQNAVGYEIEYRYPNQPIKIKIIKFINKDNMQDFWRNWLAIHSLEKFNKNEFVKFPVNGQVTTNYAVYAWQKGQWFTYIGVPTQTPQSEPLRDKVKDLISNHYLNLAKRNIEP